MEISISITEAYREAGGELARDGRQTQMVLCIFHPDSTPSMKLDVEKNVARCYACRKNWTPKQMLDAVAGKDVERSIKQSKSLVMIDQFEKQILLEIRTSGSKAKDFVKVFEMLDIARESETIAYEKLMSLLEVVRSKI